MPPKGRKGQGNEKPKAEEERDEPLQAVVSLRSVLCLWYLLIVHADTCRPFRDEI